MNTILLLFVLGLMALGIFSHITKGDIPDELDFGIVFIVIIIINSYIEIKRRKK